MTVAFDSAKFREVFPEFSDTAKYPDAMLQTYWDLATYFISDVDCPCNILNDGALAYAISCMTAHLLTLAQRSADAAAEGTSPTGGVEISASIGEVSVSMMQPPAANGWQYWLSQTPYGQMLWALLSIKAVGGLSVGGLPERLGFRKVGGVFL